MFSSFCGTKLFLWINSSWQLLQNTYEVPPGISSRKVVDKQFPLASATAGWMFSSGWIMDAADEHNLMISRLLFTPNCYSAVVEAGAEEWMTKENSKQQIECETASCEKWLPWSWFLSAGDRMKSSDKSDAMKISTVLSSPPSKIQQHLELLRAQNVNSKCNNSL